MEIHDDHFQPATPDAEWLSHVGKLGWVVLTKDQRIRYRAVESAALWRAKVAAFILTAGGDLSGAEIGQIFVKALPEIKKLCAKTAPPFIAHVSKGGAVKLVKS